jgi:hypothetical protein
LTIVQKLKKSTVHLKTVLKVIVSLKNQQWLMNQIALNAQHQQSIQHLLLLRLLLLKKM